jgi:multisubunit Na+/H+ antiporter MnhB subunit
MNESRKRSVAEPREATGIMVRTVAKLLLLPALVVAVAMLVKGYVQTGDGFSAGVVAALGVLLQYLAFGHRKAEELPLVGPAGKGAFAGLLVVLLVATIPLFAGQPVLTHYPQPGSEVVHLGTLELLTAVLFDLGVFLLVFGFAVESIKLIARAIADEEEYRGPDIANADDLAGEESR